jgi:hypothetical protein
MRQRTILDEIRARAILVVAVLILASCGGGNAAETDAAAAADPAAEQESTTTTEPPTTTTTAAPTTTEPENVLQVGDVLVGEAELDMLEPAVTISAEDPWNVVEVMDGAVIFEDPDKLSPWTNAVLLVESVPFAATIDDWADTHDTATIESRSETQVGRLDAVVYDISYTGENELAVLTAPWGQIIVRNTEYYRIWMVETGGEKPLALFVPVLTDDLDWLDKAEKLVATIEFAA